MNLPLFARDKLLHFSYGTAISAAVTVAVTVLAAIAIYFDFYAMIAAGFALCAPVIGWGTSTGVGIGWEVWQKANGGTNSQEEQFKDAFAVSAGGLMVAFPAQVWILVS